MEARLLAKINALQWMVNELQGKIGGDAEV